MGTFDSFRDSPFNDIRNEGQEITLSFTRTGPTTGRISWNIPTPMSGCATEQQIYDGIVITLDTTPTSLSKVPVNGTRYTADPTASRELHAGDQIDTALVVGAFYNDKETVFVDVTDLNPNTPYYASGHAVDNVLKYHLEGVHAYVQGLSGEDLAEEQFGYHILEIGIEGPDSTGLELGNEYDYVVFLDTFEADEGRTLSVNGSDAQTYDELVAALNKNFALWDDPMQSAGIPDVGKYYYDSANSALYQWDGTTHNQLDVIVEGTDPSTPTLDDYWYDTDNEILYKWDGAAWVAQTVIEYHQDPTMLNCDDWWFNGTDAYQWNGTVWEDRNVYAQNTDPSQPVAQSCPLYWFDTVNEFMWELNEVTQSWTEVDPVIWPTTVVVDGDYWYDHVNQILYQLVVGIWEEQTVTIDTEAPALPAPGTLWLNPETEELYTWNNITDMWDLTPAIVSSYDPVDPPSGAIWWNTGPNPDQLFTWDTQTNSWQIISNIPGTYALVQEEDPLAPPTLVQGYDTWYNTDTNLFYVWDGGAWVETPVIVHPTDPANLTVATINTAWLNTSDGTFWNWEGTMWGQVYPTLNDTDPYTPIAGDFWFNTTNDSLNIWSGTGWNTVLYSTSPLTPEIGDQYFDTNTNLLMEWTNDGWVQTDPVVVVEINDEGNLVFTRTEAGSCHSVMVANPNPLGDYALWHNLEQSVVFTTPWKGTDEISGKPMYAQVGVGNDGSSDERRELIDSMRAQLGYPIVTVELTKYQWDRAVDDAIEVIRQRSSTAYKRAFFWLALEPGKQFYTLSDECVGFNKIVDIMTIYRTQSSFLGTAEGQGVYGQLLLQHLYQMGTFDLVSYHLVNQYIETMGHLFAEGLQYHFDEHTRQLHLYQAFWREEKVLLDAVIERTEQELITDRWTKQWVEKYAMARAMEMLALIRGKYASLPGAGGGVQLNAAELITMAERDKAECMAEIDDFVADNKEDIGMASDFIIG